VHQDYLLFLFHSISILILFQFYFSDGKCMGPKSCRRVPQSLPHFYSSIDELLELARFT